MNYNCYKLEYPWVTGNEMEVDLPMKRGNVLLAIPLLLLMVVTSVAAAPQVSYPSSLLEGADLQVSLEVDSDEEKVAEVLVYVAAGETYSSYTMSRAGDGRYSVTIPGSLLPAGDLSLYFEIVASDATSVTLPGEGASHPFSIHRMTDNEKPVIKLVSPRRKIYVRKQETFLFVVNDNSGNITPGSIQVLIDGRPAVFSYAPGFIAVSPTFSLPGEHTVEITVTDIARNTTSECFRLKVVERLTTFGAGYRLDAGLSLNEGAAEPVARFSGDATLQVGRLLDLDVSISLDKDDPLLAGTQGQPVNRFGLQAQLGSSDLFRLKLLAGDFPARMSSLTLNTASMRGYGLDASLLGFLQPQAYFGRVKSEVPGDTLERNILALRPAFGIGSLMDVGINAMLAGDRYYPAIDEGEPGARTNAVVGAGMNLDLFHMHFGMEAAASLDIQDIHKAVPYEGGYLLAGGEGPFVDPEEIGIPASLYELFPIPELSLEQVMGRKIVPGTAARIDLDLPVSCYANLNSSYTYTDSDFTSLGASTGSGNEKMEATLRLQPLPYLRMNLSHSDERVIEDNVLMQLVGQELLAELLEESDGPVDPQDSEPPTIQSVRTWRAGLSLDVDLKMLRLKPAWGYEAEGHDEFTTFLPDLWRKIGTGIPPDQIEQTSTTWGLDVDDLAFDAWEFAGGYRLTSVHERDPATDKTGHEFWVDAYYGDYSAGYRFNADTAVAGADRTTEHQVVAGAYLGGWSFDAGITYTAGGDTSSGVRTDLGAGYSTPIADGAVGGLSINYSLSSGQNPVSHSGSISAFIQGGF